MTLENSTVTVFAATYTHDTLCHDEYMAYVKSLSGPVSDIDTSYSHIEYMNVGFHAELSRFFHREVSHL
ncbi:MULTISPECIES: hypothetical protein [unclassified Rhizobium]|uniref:hypothetical protein n=1 Tax=unclassified Rhizobium TaxID=2613769 RepID=UPI001AD99B8E|nr:MULTISPECIES: hypothetical protein [unclassified Rhizobium]MBO9097633.1 hypothetical protein [Rhizobium sp. L58/93]MBO9183828.1 hypothetical protein [Rhizobium sp. E27B/91]QXZ84079.1 hypothetical protein J5287_00415 [Rhizobium sp. K1/93]QXZ88408.1 hypothetical protein J5280_09585 [Rhizobium sp. K15/93]QYA00993.1 hypothetical protein J5278_14840 [Rhizobium sp. B21/90]